MKLPSFPVCRRARCVGRYAAVAHRSTKLLCSCVDLDSLVDSLGAASLPGALVGKAAAHAHHGDAEAYV